MKERTETEVHKYAIFQLTSSLENWSESGCFDIKRFYSVSINKIWIGRDLDEPTVLQYFCEVPIGDVIRCCKKAQMPSFEIHKISEYRCSPGVSPECEANCTANARVLSCFRRSHLGKYGNFENINWFKLYFLWETNDIVVAYQIIWERLRLYTWTNNLDITVKLHKFS